MWRCLDCGSVFDETDVKMIRECMGDAYGSPAYETWNACPFCESTDIEMYDPDEDPDEEEYIMSMEEEDE